MSGSSNVVLGGRCHLDLICQGFANRQRQAVANLLKTSAIDIPKHDFRPPQNLFWMVRCRSDLSLTAATITVGTPETSVSPLQLGLGWSSVIDAPRLEGFPRKKRQFLAKAPGTRGYQTHQKTPLTPQNMISQKSVLDGFLPPRPCFRRFCRPAAAILVLCSKQQQQPQMTPKNTISGTSQCS